MTESPADKSEDTSGGANPICGICGVQLTNADLEIIQKRKLKHNVLPPGQLRPERVPFLLQGPGDRSSNAKAQRGQ